MPPIVIPGSYMVVCSGNNQGEPWANVYGVAKSGITLDETVAGTIAFDFKAWYEALAGLFSTGWGLTNITVTDITSTDAPQFAFPTTTTVGTLTDAALPTYVALAVTWRTARRGRSFRGRTYLCGFTEAGNGPGGFPQSSYTDGIEEEAANLIEALDGDGHALTVLSRTLLEANAVVTANVNGFWDTMRRRKNG